MATKATLITVVLFLLAAIPSFSQCPPELVFTKSTQTLGDTRTFSIQIGDVDLDGDNDIFMSNYHGWSTLWLNDGTGVFTPSPQIFDITGVHGVGIQDLNGDTWPDIFLISQDGPSKVFFNDGDGTFTKGTQNISTGDLPFKLLMADADNDGDIDAFIACAQSPTLWLNDGSGVFTLSSAQFGTTTVATMAVADVNNDSYTDIFLAKVDQPDEVWLNDGMGNFTNSGQALGSSTGYEDVVAGDIDNDGDHQALAQSR
jgi:hypothetical protein